MSTRLSYHRTRLFVLATVLYPLSHGMSARAQQVDAKKVQKVKAAYLYNFTKFVEWPTEAFTNNETLFLIGVIGDGDFFSALSSTVQGKRIAKREVKVKLFDWRNQSDRAALDTCQMIFVSDAYSSQMNGILKVLRRRPVLVVGDAPRFAHQGGMIGFIFEKTRIVFEINRKEIERAGLKASAKLLKLARIVES